MIDAVYRIRSGGGSATAICVHPKGWFLTCAHSVSDSPEVAIIREDFVLEYVLAEVKALDERNDVALLFAPSERAYAAVPLAGRGPHVGEPLRVVGRVPWSVQDDYAIDGTYNVFELQHAAIAPALCLTIFPATDNVPATLAYITDDPVNTGWSGGAVTRVGSLEVVGMHSGSMSRGIGRGVPVETLAGLLKKHRVRSRRASAGRPRRTPSEDRRGWRAAAEENVSRFISRFPVESLEDPEEVQRARTFLQTYADALPDDPLVGLAIAYLAHHDGNRTEAAERVINAFEAKHFMSACIVAKDLQFSEDDLVRILAAVERAHSTVAGSTSVVGWAIRDDLEHTQAWLLRELKGQDQLAEFLEQSLASSPPAKVQPTRRLWHARALALAGRGEEAAAIFASVYESDPDDFLDLDFTFWVSHLCKCEQQDNVSLGIRIALNRIGVLSSHRELFEHAASAAGASGAVSLATILLERAQFALPCPELGHE